MMRCQWAFGATAVVGVASAVLFWSSSARAAEPTIEECLSASETSLTLRRQHRLRDARAALRVCAARSCPHDVRVECEKRTAQVTAQLPTLVFEAKDEAGRALLDVAVKMDDQPFPEGVPGATFAVDPGEHTFVFEAEGRAPVKKTLVLREGEKGRKELLVFPAAGAVPPASERGATTPATTAAPSGNGQRKAALIVGGVGVLGVAVGLASGIVAADKWSASKTECESATQCLDHDRAVLDQQRASGAATISTVAFVGGGIALASGVALWFLTPKGDVGTERAATIHVQPTVAPGVGGFSIRGVF